MRKIEAIDGLRAVAVAAVILFHQDLLYFGWIGVWIFFVISGFVITMSLADGPRFDKLSTNIKYFYMKRSLRILPLYVALILFSVIFIELNITQNNLEYVLGYLPFLLTGTFNFYRISPNYVETQLVGHYWSLCVEEQFYLLYPILFYTLSGRNLRRTLIAIVILAPAIRYGAGLIASAEGLSPRQVGAAVYFFSPGQFDAFAAGCLLALHRGGIAASETLRRNFALLAGACVLLVAAYLAVNISAAPEADLGTALDAAFWVSVTGGFNQVLLYTIIDAGSCLVLVGILCNVPYIAGPLSNPVLTYVGKISYGIYMIHRPLQFLYWNVLKHIWSRLGLHGNGPPEWAAFPVYLLILLGLSALSFRYFESYFLSKQRSFKERPTNRRTATLAR